MAVAISSSSSSIVCRHALLVLLDMAKVRFDHLAKQVRYLLGNVVKSDFSHVKHYQQCMPADNPAADAAAASYWRAGWLWSLLLPILLLLSLVLT